MRNGFRPERAVATVAVSASGWSATTVGCSDRPEGATWRCAGLGLDRKEPAASWRTGTKRPGLRSGRAVRFRELRPRPRPNANSTGRATGAARRRNVPTPTPDCQEPVRVWRRSSDLILGSTPAAGEQPSRPFLCRPNQCRMFTPKSSLVHHTRIGLLAQTFVLVSVLTAGQLALLCRLVRPSQVKSFKLVPQSHCLRARTRVRSRPQRSRLLPGSRPPDGSHWLPSGFKLRGLCPQRTNGLTSRPVRLPGRRWLMMKMIRPKFPVLISDLQKKAKEKQGPAYGAGGVLA